MAHIKLMDDKPRTLPWRAHINRKGLKPLVKMFANKSEAEHWASEQERGIRLNGLPQTIDALKKHTVKEIVSRYLEEVTPSKGCYVSETTVLKKFLRTDLAGKSLAYVSETDGYAYRNKRLKEVLPSTVRREMNSLQHVFEVARKEWGHTSLKNPFRGISIKGSDRQRDRRLHHGELERLIEACKKCHGLNRLYVPLAIYLAVETGIRQQEILGLTWEDLDFVNRRIRIRKSKTDHVTGKSGRTIVMSAMAMLYVLRLSQQLHAIHGEFSVKPNDKVFLNRDEKPMTTNGFKLTWNHVLDNAGINDLHFHDLRHEAGSRFDEANLTKAEHNLMMGHTPKDMTSRYITSDLNRIQDKLDKHLFNGKTLAEVEAEEGAIWFEGQLVSITSSPGGTVVSFPALDTPSTPVRTKREIGAAK